MKALAAIAIVVLAVPPPAAADSPAQITDIGWWTRNPAPSAPAGGFEVARAPDGDLSVAAIRVLVNGRLTKGVLSLSESRGVRQDAAGIRACATPNAWTAAKPGAWADAPKADCSIGAVQLTRNASSQWTGDIAFLLGNASGQSVSVMIVPIPPVSADPGFQVQFGSASIDADAAPEAPSSSFGGSSPVTVASGTGPAAQAPAAVGVEAPSVAAPPAEVPNPLAEPLQPANSYPVAQPSAGGRGRPWGRLIPLVPLAAVVGAGASFARRLAGRG